MLIHLRFSMNGKSLGQPRTPLLLMDEKAQRDGERKNPLSTHSIFTIRKLRKEWIGSKDERITITVNIIFVGIGNCLNPAVSFPDGT